MREKSKKRLKELVIGIILLAAVFISISIFSSVPAVKLSCVDGEFIGIGSMNLPMMCAACIPYCRAEVVISDEKGLILCESAGSDGGTGMLDDNVAIVACPKLKKYKGQELNLKYSIKSNNLNYSNEKIIIYNGTK